MELQLLSHADRNEATLDMVTSLDTYNFFNLAAQVAAWLTSDR